MSPCIGICTLGPGAVCVGCNRSLYTITRVGDLVPRIKDDIANAAENGHNLFEAMTDKEIAEDIIGCTGGYDDFTTEELTQAVWYVRKTND